jgi:hypothetical protein
MSLTYSVAKLALIIHIAKQFSNFFYIYLKLLIIIHLDFYLRPSSTTADPLPEGLIVESGDREEEDENCEEERYDHYYAYASRDQRRGIGVENA